MAKASYAPMFETVSGALNKINKKSPHAGDQKMVLATHRTAPTTTTLVLAVNLTQVCQVDPPKHFFFSTVHGAFSF